MALKIDHSVNVDFTRKNSIPVLHMKQGDEGTREITVHFFNNGTAYAVPYDATLIQISYAKSDGIGGAYDTLPDEETAAGEFSNDRKSCTVQLVGQVLNVPGVVYCEVKLFTAAKECLNTGNLLIDVEKSPLAMTSASEGYYRSAYDGATFTPHISSDGILSWTNDKGLPNPEAVNLNSALKTGDLSNLDTTDKSNLVAAINEVLAAARAAGTPIATATPATEGTDDYAASGDDLPVVQKGDSEQPIRPVGKGCQVVFIPTRKNLTTSPTLAINDGEEIAIKLRSSSNQGGNDSRPDATVSVPIGALQRGVPYTMSFCGKYWLLDSMIGGIGGGGGGDTITPDRIDGATLLNLYDNDAEIRDNQVFNYSTHVFDQNAQYWSSYDIPLVGGKTYTISFRPYIIAIFDENGNYKDRIAPGSPSGTTPYTFTVPGNGNLLCAFSTQKSKLPVESSVSIAEGSAAVPADLPHKYSIDWLYYDISDELDSLMIGTEKIEDGAVIEQKIADNAISAEKIVDGAVTSDKTDFIEKQINNLFDPGKALADTTINSSGEAVPYASYYSSDYIHVDYGSIYYAYKMSGGGYNLSNVAVPYRVFEYNSQHSPIAAATLSVHEESGKAITYTPSSSNVAFVRISFRPLSDIDNTMFVGTFSPMVQRNRKALVGIAPTIEGHRAGELLVTLGDSITRGYSNGETLPDGSTLPVGGQIPYPYGRYAAKLLDMEYVNFGSDGSTVAKIIERITSQTYLAGLPVTAEVITVMVGTNDMAQVPLGTESDEYDASNLTFYGGLKEIARLLSETYMGSTIVFLTPIRVHASARNYIDAVKYVAELYDIPCMDMNKILRYSQKNANGAYYISDYYNGLHPNQAGHIRMGKALAGFLNTI